MARRRYRRYRRKSGRWSANIQEVSNTVTTLSSQVNPFPGPWYAAETICSNPTQQPTYVSQTFTIKNVEANFVIEIDNLDSNLQAALALENIVAYIMFVPQGMTVTEDFNTNHPEYIMTYKYLGSPTNELTIPTTSQSDTIATGQQYQPYRVKTRLSRKLQSGDSIILFLKGLNQYTSSLSFRLNGLIRWWTKAN